MPLAAVVDCEALGAGWPQQPVNAWSSLAFVVVGAFIVGRGRNRSGLRVGSATALVGIGSLLFHGEVTDFSRWVHDWSIVVLLVLLISHGLDTLHPLVSPGGTTAAGILIWLFPGAGEWIAAVLALAVGLRELVALRDGAVPAMALAQALAVLAVPMTILGRTSGPWCRPESVLQPHAAWHVLAAVALGSYAVARGWASTGSRTRERSPGF